MGKEAAIGRKYTWPPPEQRAPCYGIGSQSERVDEEKHRNFPQGLDRERLFGILVTTSVRTAGTDRKTIRVHTQALSIRTQGSYIHITH